MKQCSSHASSGPDSAGTGNSVVSEEGVRSTRAGAEAGTTVEAASLCCARPLAPLKPPSHGSGTEQLPCSLWPKLIPGSGEKHKTTRNPGQLSLLLPEGFHQYNGSKYNTFLRAVERAYNWDRSF